MARWILAGCMIAALVACDDNNNSDRARFTGGSVLGPEAGATVQISPQTFSIGTPFVRSCIGNFFRPSFVLVITPVVSRNQAIESATFRLIDGTTRGGPSVTFPQPVLTQMFGTVFLLGRRSFAFTPSFVCPVVPPLAMTADIMLTDGQRLTASMGMQ
ncbi:MAG TPA: hypothetical protein VKD69_21225 [Vicinamibacterales bacterium]|nr:hypothetical protein [Vicinamibacterales bacterium]